MSENNEIPCNAGGEPCTVDTLKSAPTSSPLTSAPASEIQPAPISECVINKVPVQLESCPLPSTTTDIESAKDEKSPAENDAKTNNNDELTAISRLEQEVQKRTHERDNYQKKLVETEKKLSALQASYNAIISGDDDEITLRREMEDLKNMLTQTQLKLDDRGRLVVNQENQINALSKQVSSLKEVVAITKDLLNIRNMEVKHLQNDVDTMENRITAERERHNVMLTKMDTAVRLNADLKKEYETQLRLFQDLRGKYEQKVTLLSEENRALEAAAQSTV